jgi:hypothetical protein
MTISDVNGEDYICVSIRRCLEDNESVTFTYTVRTDVIRLLSV